jgi:hypothetical protein
MQTVKDYTASQADVRLTSDGQNGIVLFLTPEGWVGVELGRRDLEALRDRILAELSRPVPPAQRH